MQDIITEILNLQQKFSAQNTEPMKRRGILVRNELKTVFSARVAMLNTALRKNYPGSLSFEGRDGTGRKTYIPWHRIYVEELSPSAQDGWYVVFLFKADGSGVYLCLSHGSTQFDGMSFIPRSDSELGQLVTFARETLKGETQNISRLVFDIDLANTGTLATAYPKSTAFAYYYPLESMPRTESLLKDIAQFVEWLGVIYENVELGRTPTSNLPDVLVVNEVVSKRKQPGQGRGLSGEERKCVELHAMARARELLSNLGYSVIDVSNKKSFDFEAKLGDEKICVEVKGTTGFAGSILMTRNEVELHRNEYPNNALIIVSEIDLERGKSPKTSGGQITYAKPWRVPDDRLFPITYEVKAPLSP